MDELLTKMYGNIEEFMDYWKGKSNQTILEMRDFLIASAEKKGWNIDRLKKFLEDTQNATEAVKKLQTQKEEKERAIQAKEEAAKRIEGLKDVTDPEKIKEDLESIGEIPSLMASIEPVKPYSLEAIKADIKNYDPSKFFCPKLFTDGESVLPFPDGTLSVIGARTSRGKTTTLINLAAEAIEDGRKCLFITLEMSVRQLYPKLVLQRAYSQANDDTKLKLKIVPHPSNELHKFLKSDGKATGLNETFRESVDSAVKFVDDKFKTNMLQMYQAWSLTQTQIISLILQQEKGTLVLVDYIQRMPIADTRNRDRYIQIKELSDALVNATKNSGVVTICGAQFNRVAGKDDDGNDAFDDTSFRESGDIEQDAENAIGIGWKKNKEDRFYGLIKAREAGITEKRFELEFNGAYSYMTCTSKSFVPKEKNTNGQQPAERWDYNAVNRNVSGTPI